MNNRILAIIGSLGALLLRHLWLSGGAALLRSLWSSIILIIRHSAFRATPLRGVVLFSSLLVSTVHASEAPETVAAPPIPSIQRITVLPAAVTLNEGRDERHLLVIGESADGTTIDLTTVATFTNVGSAISVNARGLVTPKEKGSASVLITAAGLTQKVAVAVKDSSMLPVRFVRDIAPVMTKAGCNAGTCHGSDKGKNGFKLSLRGYDPDYDYEALINDISGRRFNRVNVDESLMLQKPTAEVPHEGRQVIKPGSREYQLIRAWINEGAKPERAAVGRATRIEVLPAEIGMDLPGRSRQLIVLAHYADGTTRDVTREAAFSSSNTDVAEVKENQVRALRRGEAAVLIRYEGIYATRELTVMGDRTGFQWAEVPANNFVDEHIYAKLKKVKTLPSELCTDAEFVRRVSLDLTGLPPRPERVRSFLADTNETRIKRDRLIDELIGSRDYVSHWANKWADLLQCNSENLGQKGVWVYRQWIEKSIGENVPYDEFVRRILLAQGSTYENPPANYYRVLKEPGKITEDVSQTFLGVRFNCNKCHDHPFEKWTQNQYYEFGAHFARVTSKKGTLPGEEVIFVNHNGGEVNHLKTGMPVPARVPFGSAREAKGDEDRRVAFVEWMTSKKNPFFAKSMANRTWSYFFGRGIIEPVDDIRAGNPPSNAALLDALTQQFVASGFDLRKLMATICKSRTYQLSMVKNKWNDDDVVNFSHASPRRLSAEQMLDAVAVATGVRPQFAGLPPGLRPVEVPDGNVAGNDFLTLFGRPKRQSACECERTSNMSLSHALNMINGITLSDAIDSPESRIAKLVQVEKDDQKLVEEIYVACLNRMPTKKELSVIDFSKSKSRLELAQDLAWALINSPAFMFNR